MMGVNQRGGKGRPGSLPQVRGQPFYSRASLRELILEIRLLLSRWPWPAPGRRLAVSGFFVATQCRDF
jgi:hypothetical protein